MSEIRPQYFEAAPGDHRVNGVLYKRQIDHLQNTGIEHTSCWI